MHRAFFLRFTRPQRQCQGSDNANANSDLTEVLASVDVLSVVFGLTSLSVLVYAYVR